jgi:hypothetical protein
MSLLNKVIAEINVNCNDKTDYEKMISRHVALKTISDFIKVDGLYQYAKNFNVLVEDSAEDFALEFYAAYNNEVTRLY